MEDKVRRTAIKVVGDVPWGTHFCQFYQTKEDLIDILVPYFRAGLKDNEFCMWVTSEPLNVEDAKKALKKKVKDLDDYIKKGQIEILDYSQWYTKSGGFDSDRVLQGWVEKEKQALKKGFEGLRLTGNTFWLEEEDWEDFTNYEAAVNSVIGQHRMLAVCTYCLDKCTASEIVDVVSNHQFALIKREGRWEIIESAEHKKIAQALRESRDELQQKVRERTASLLEANEQLKEENEERLRAEQSLRLEEARLDVLLRLSRMSEASVDEIAGFTLEQGVKLTQSRIGFLGFLSEDELIYTLHAVSKNVVKGCAVAGDPVQWHIVEAGIWADAIRQRKTLFVNDYSKPHPNKKGLPPGHLPLERLMVVPVFEEGRIVAVAGVGNKASDYDNADERQIMLLLSGMWGYVQRNRSREALERAHDGLEKRVRERTAELEKANAELEVEIADRKKAEEALHESEDKYRAIFAQAADSIVLIDPENGALVDFNDRAHESLGYTREELQKLNIADFEAIESAEEVGKHIKKIVREGGDTFETKHRTKSGEIRDFLASSRVISIGGKNLVQSIWQDITDRKDMEAQQIFAGKILERLNQESGSLDLVRNVLALVKESTGFEAVGIRLREAGDFPYFAVKGFSDEFVEAENYLCARDENGEHIYDSQGNTVLECMCGNVLSGRTDPALPFFTEGGSFWTNSTTTLLASTSEQERQGLTRNRCNKAGYESVALIPLRSSEEIVGLLQLNDTQWGRFTPEMIGFFEGIGASIGITLARIRAEEEAKNLAKFPSEDPNPVLRITKDGILLYANAASKSFLAEWDCEVGQIVPENWRQMVSEAFASKSGKRIEIEQAQRTFSFVFAPVPEADYVNVYGRDITERKMAQENISLQKKLLENTFESLPHPFYVIDPKDYTIKLANTATFVYGSLSESSTCYALTHKAPTPCRGREHPCPLEHVMKTKKPAVFEHIHYDKDGNDRNVEVHAYPVLDSAGNVTQVIEYCLDVTERKQAQEQMQNLAKFPSENPFPVLRIAKDGTILYANSAGAELLKDWGCEVGSHAPEYWCQYILRILKSESSEELEVACRDRIFSMIMAPVVDAKYVNIYGTDITERKRAEEDLRKYRQHLEELVEERTGELTEANKQLLEQIGRGKQLERSILDISEREQRRIGRELHDSIGQQFTGIAFMTKVLEQKLATKLPEEAASAEEIGKLVNQAMDQTRGLVKVLEPVTLDAGSLMLALQEFSATTEHLFGIRCTFKCDKPVPIDDATVAVHLYRMTQEAVTNAIKHGGAKNIQIELVQDKDKSVLRVKSDGIDFPGMQVKGKGMGLQIMDHRAEILGGSLDIRKGDKGGTIVTCIFPTKNVNNNSEKDYGSKEDAG